MCLMKLCCLEVKLTSPPFDLRPSALLRRTAGDRMLAAGPQKSAERGACPQREYVFELLTEKF